MSANGKTDDFTPRQIAFLKNYLDPTSTTFSDAKNSAIAAGYSEEYAAVITRKTIEWVSVGVSRRKGMLNKAEMRLEALIDSDDERVGADIAKFIAKTQGKDKGYSERTEVTGADGKDLVPSEEIKKEIRSKLHDVL